ncbi:MAG TPA: hypothetical protein VFG42_13180 [Baekduia sp.]|uniref:hypothetical protein n=1 Tax=Baekduia sp. TaxID=2600305 RepID=UPI002D796693|nr:hypothetical protein [Baekduia sp.]HET6507737.1 hypothetical protein [Baekduia sp.]
MIDTTIDDPEVPSDAPAVDEDVPPAAESRPRVTTAVVVCGILAAVALISSFSQPSSLLAVALFGGYAYHLYRGGRDITGVRGDGTARARAWLAWGAVAGVALIAGFTWAPALVIAVAAGGYAAYLFSGGRDVTREARNGARRSAAWMYYAGIAAVAAVLGLHHAGALLVTLVAGGYAIYLYRGGRWVLWIW